MWLFTKYGFYSAVCARQRSGGHNKPVDPDRIMVRARHRTHHDALKDRFPQLIGECAIMEYVGTDYAFRIFVEKPIWCQIVVGLCEEMDYDNFNSKVARYQGREGAPYEDAWHDVWSLMKRLLR